MQKLAAESEKYAPLRFVDAVEFVSEHVLDRLTVSEPVRSMAVHPTCSSVQLGINDHLMRLANAAAERATVPFAWGCCGYAGDRGMLHPELTAAATAPEAAEVNATYYDAYVSLNRTCEQGMTEATGKPYEHVLQVLERTTR